MTFSEIYQKIDYALEYRLFEVAGAVVSLGNIIKFTIIAIVAFKLARYLAKIISEKLLVRLPIDDGTRYVFKRVSEYLFLIAGFAFALRAINFDMTGLTVLFGLLSVGIGFGLQNIASNFVSGLILLFERPIKVGDRVTVSNIEGDVEEINIRSTTVRSLNNISIIVPNSEFISSHVINWSHADPKVRLDIEVGVSYESNLDDVLDALKQVGRENSEVLQSPEPEVLLLSFGDSSWNMQLRIWIYNPKRHWYVRSDINCAIVRKFRERNITIPFPQRDVHMYSTNTKSSQNPVN